MADYRINKGYEIPILGKAEQKIADLPQPPFVGVCPKEFKGIKPKLAVRVDQEIDVGTPLFVDKSRPELVFASPAAGRVTAINYGPRRVIEEIIIATSEKYTYLDHKAYNEAAIAKLDRGTLINHLHTGGVWGYLEQRPFNRIADATVAAKAIFVNCMNTAPLANDPNFSLDGKDEAFSAGIAAMKVLSDKVHVVTRKEAPNAFFKKPQGVSHHTFSGIHPTGLVGTHITQIDPINKGEAVWTIHARDLVMIGDFLLKGRYPIERVVALVGPGVKQPTYYRTQLGVKMADLVKDRVIDGEMRFVSGDVLSGRTTAAQGFLGASDDMVTVLAEGRKQDFLGWMMPGTKRPSFTRALLAGFMPGKKFAMNTNMNGGHRAIIQSGLYDRMVALDVFPEYLLKATIAQDLDAMEQLGILECAPEDFALCTYVCPSKTEVSQIIEEGLAFYEKEG